MKRRSLKACHVAVDGSVFNKYPQFHNRVMEALEDIFEWPRDEKAHPVKLVPAVDGSSVGAAVICAFHSNLRYSAPLQRLYGHLVRDHGCAASV